MLLLYQTARLLSSKTLDLQAKILYNDIKRMGKAFAGGKA